MSMYAACHGFRISLKKKPWDFHNCAPLHQLSTYYHVHEMCPLALIKFSRQWTRWICWNSEQIDMKLWMADLVIYRWIWKLRERLRKRVRKGRDRWEKDLVQELNAEEWTVARFLRTSRVRWVDVFYDLVEKKITSCNSLHLSVALYNAEKYDVASQWWGEIRYHLFIHNLISARCLFLFMFACLFVCFFVFCFFYSPKSQC